MSDVSVTVSVTDNKKAYVRKLKEMTCFKGATRFAHLEKTSLVFQVRHLQFSLIFASLRFDLFLRRKCFLSKKTIILRFYSI